LKGAFFMARNNRGFGGNQAGRTPGANRETGLGGAANFEFGNELGPAGANGAGTAGAAGNQAGRTGNAARQAFRGARNRNGQ
jgi:hypothetical protein